MEASGVSKLYSRSIERHNIHYIPFIGDGDSSSYSCVCVEQPYGPTVYIPKVDCIAHVSKSMGSNLRSLLKDYKGKHSCTIFAHIFVHSFAITLVIRSRRLQPWRLVTKPNGATRWAGKNWARSNWIILTAFFIYRNIGTKQQRTVGCC